MYAKACVTIYIMSPFITKNNEEMIIDIWDHYFKKGTIQIVKRRDNQETNFIFQSKFQYHIFRCRILVCWHLNV